MAEEQRKKDNGKKEEDQKKDRGLPGADDICAICNDGLKPGDENLTRLRCGHWLHHDCAAKSLKKFTRCPLCRREVRAPPSRDAAHGPCSVADRFATDARRAAEQTPLSAVRDLTLFVKSLTGKQYSFTLGSADLVAHLMLAIQRADGTPFDQMRLIWAGQQLEPLRLLGDHRIPTMSTVHMVLRLRGGKPVICFQSPRDHEKVSFVVDLPQGSRLSSVWPVPSTSEGCCVSWVASYSAMTGMLSTSWATDCTYLFYEFDMAPGFAPEFHDSRAMVLVAARYVDVADFLRDLADAEGLDARNRDDFVTWWLPQMMRPDEEPATFAFDVLHDEEYEKLVHLCVYIDDHNPHSSLPKMVSHRFFMLWKKGASATPTPTTYVKLRTFNPWNEAARERVCPCVLEWGGCRVDA